MVRMVDCHAGVLGSNPGGPKRFSPWNYFKGNSPYPAMPDIRINKKGTQKLLKDLNPHKATGQDEVPSRILKIGAEELSPALVKLYQHSIDVGEVPQEWRDANVVQKSIRA